MKKLMLICAPVSSRSGYGDHARDLTHSFIDHNKYDIKILDVRWGDCPRNALDNNNNNDKKIISRILPQPQLDRQPDVYVDIRIPNEFQNVGKFNIGITAGVETTAVSQAFLEGCNKMDLIIVPSEHSKKGFVETIFDQVDNNTKQKVGEFKIQKPVEVVFEGCKDVFKSIDNASLDVVDDIKEDFAFLTVGQWTKGGYGEDRKDLGKTIKVFFETFANKDNQPALIMKTNGATYSLMDREDCLNRIREIKSKFPSEWKLPSVYLLHGDLSMEQLNDLYNHPKIKALVSFTHGEGFGRPLLEATMTGLPVIASNWSGQLDFLDEDKSILIDGDMIQVPKSVVWKDIIIPESTWFNIKESDAKKALNYVFENESSVRKDAVKLMKINNDKFSHSSMTTLLNGILDKYTKDLPSQVGLQLPKLKKSSNSKESGLPELKLPKLKKVSSEEGVSV